MTNWIYEYIGRIKSGSVTVGKWVRLQYEYIERGLKREEFYYSERLAHKAIDFIENFCHHSEGRNDLLKLECWQKAMISVIFGIVDIMGLRVFREAFAVISRKQGKTILAAAIIAYMTYVDGEYGCKVYCIAPKLEQAMLVYDAFYQIVLKDDELSSITKKRRSDIYVPELNSSVKPMPFSAKKSDGLNPNLVVCDEVAAWSGDGGLKQYEVARSALGARRQPLILSISTAGYINDSIYDELMKRATAVLSGNSTEHRLCAFLYMIDDPDKWDDIEELKKASPNMGISVKEQYYLDEIEIARNSLSKKVEFLTKYCNVKQNSSVAWLPYETIAKCVTPGLKIEDFKSSYCVGGIDLSQTTDLTACSVVIEKDSELYVFTQFFMPSNRITDLQERDGVPYELFVKKGIIIESGENYIDYQDCYNWFVNLVEEHEILPLKIGYDRYSAQYLINDLKAYGFHVDDVYQGENLTPVLREYEGVILDGHLHFDNPLLQAHFLNVAMKQNSETRKIRPIKMEERSHIDGFVSVIDALTVRQKWSDQIRDRLRNEG